MHITHDVGIIIAIFVTVGVAMTVLVTADFGVAKNMQVLSIHPCACACACACPWVYISRK